VAVTAQYTEQVVAMVAPAMRKYLEDQAETRNVSMAVVIREMLDSSRAMQEKEAGL
jgi:hypothetical protein